MTNSIALVLGAVIIGGIVFDLTTYDGSNLLFLGKKFMELIEWMAFWR